MPEGKRNPHSLLLTALTGGILVCSLLAVLGQLVPLSSVAVVVLGGASMVLAFKTGRSPGRVPRAPGDKGAVELARTCYETTIKVSYMGRLSREAGLDVLRKAESLLGTLSRLRTEIRRMRQVSADPTSASSPIASSGRGRLAAWAGDSIGKPLGPIFQEIVAAVREMAVVLREVDHNAKELITSTEETAYSMSRLDSFLQDMANSGRDLEASTDTANRVALEGTKVVEEMGRENEAIITTVNEAASAVEDLGRWSQEVGKIVEVIRDIADETNLLALNASIIAAQSGEHGKAFGVVAEEIRGLAERTSSSTKEISDLVKAVQKNVANVVNGMKKSLQRVERGELLTRNAGMVLEKVFESFESSRNLAKQIASSTFEHKIDSSQVVRSLHKVTEIAQRLQAHNYKGWAGTGETLGIARALGALCEEPDGSSGGVTARGLRPEGHIDSGAATAGDSGKGDLQELLAACDREIDCCVDSLEQTKDTLDSWIRSLEQVSEVTANCLGRASAGWVPSDLDACWDLVTCDRKLRDRCPAYTEDNRGLFFSRQAACAGGDEHGEVKTGEGRSARAETTRTDRVTHKVGTGQ